MLDPLRFAIAVIPLASYLLLIGWVNRHGRPLLVSGASDLATLGAALSGIALIGPIELFRPEAATAQLGNAIWIFLAVFYWLWVALLVMLCRPRLVIYNLTADEVRPALVDAVAQVDDSARWAGDSLVLPKLGIQLHLDSQPWMRVTSLISSGGKQDLMGWRRLAKSLDRSLRSVAATPGPRGGLLIASGILLILIATFALVSDPQAVLVAWQQLSQFG